MRTRLARFILAASIIARVASAAAHTPAALSYSVDPSIDGCPAEAAVRDSVAAQLGYDPFDAPSPTRTISARITGDDTGLRAVVQTLDAEGHVIGSREIASPSKDCTELAASVALSISIAIDPFHAIRVEPAPTASPPASSRAPRAPVPARASSAPVELSSTPRPARQSGPVLARTTVGALVAWGSGPATSLGFTLSGGLQWRWASLAVEGRADLPASKRATPEGRVQAFSSMGSLVPCAHRGIVAGCALISGGVLHGSGKDVDHPQARTTPFGAVGLRAAAELPVWKQLAVRLHFDVVHPLTPTDLEIDGQPVWSTPQLSSAIGLGAAATF